MKKAHRMVYPVFAVLMGLTLALPLMAADNAKDNPNDIGDRRVAGRSIISMQKEMSIGKQYANEIDRSARMIKDPVVVEYVNRLEQNIARNSDAKFPISVKVIDDPTINAMTLPGGFMYLDSGTILAADNEAELAGVLAHETGHVAERSWASEMTKRELLSFATLPLMFTPMSLGTYYALNAAMGTGIPIAFLKFGRNQEEGADFLGLQYMWKSGYDPNEYAAFFGKVVNEERQSPGSVSQIFSDHPPTPDRIIKCEEEIKNILPARPEYLENTSEFNDIKARLVTDMRVHRNLRQPGQPTLERRTPNNPPPPQPQQGKGGDTGDQPPVLGHPSQNPNQN
jgi:beta-barrel assembly-enhancing protease